MRFTTLVVLIVLIVAGIWYVNKAGWFEKAAQSADTFDVHYAKGVKAYNGMEYDAAIESFKTALTKTGDEGHRPMCLRRLGDSYKEKKMYTEAIETYERLIAEYPTHRSAADTRNAIEKIQAMGHF